MLRVFPLVDFCVVQSLRLSYVDSSHEEFRIELESARIFAGFGSYDASTEVTHPPGFCFVFSVRAFDLDRPRSAAAGSVGDVRRLLFPETNFFLVMIFVK